MKIDKSKPSNPKHKAAIKTKTKEYKPTDEDVHCSLPETITHTNEEALSMNRLWHHRYLNVSEIRKHSTGEGVTIGFVDNGIDSRHSDIAGRVSRLNTDITGERWTPGDHGTHTSSTAMEIWPELEVIDIKALSGISGGGPSGWLVARLKQVNANNANTRNKKIRFLNLSIGSQTLDPRVEAELTIFLSDPLNHCICAVGNDGTKSSSDITVDWPAALVSRLKGLIAVGAGQPSSTGEIRVVTWSSKGEGLVSLIAPGMHIYAAKARSSEGHDRRGFMSGSSMASPIVAGCIATCAKLFEEKTGRGFTQTMAEDMLLATSRDIEEDGIDGSSGMGAVDIVACYEFIDKNHDALIDIEDPEKEESKDEPLALLTPTQEKILQLVESRELEAKEILALTLNNKALEYKNLEVLPTVPEKEFLCQIDRWREKYIFQVSSSDKVNIKTVIGVMAIFILFLILAAWMLSQNM